MNKYIRYILISCAVFFLTVAFSNVFPSEKLTSTSEPTVNLSNKATTEQEENILNLWWDKGFNLEEDKALQKLVDNWEKQTGNKVQIHFYAFGLDPSSQKPQRYLQGSISPDIFMSFKSESTLNTSLAREGKLTDVEDLIEPIKEIYDQDALQTTYYYNDIDKKWSYYAVPIHQATIHIYYWKDLLEKVGRTEKDIPQDWDGFWQFWIDVHQDLKTQHQENIYPIGLPMSIEAGDTYQAFEQVLEAYNVKIIDSEGNLLVDDPKVRQGIINCLDWYSKYYRQGYVPKDAVDWTNPDNNRKFLNREILMTTNASLSIPAAVRKEPDTYNNKLGIVEFPNKPNGERMRHIFLVEQAVIFTDAPHQKLAKDFLAYLIQPEIINQYLKDSGRHSPTYETLYQDSYWNNPDDPHTSTVTKTLTKSLTRPIYPSKTPAYSLILKENVWGRSIEKIVLDNVTPEAAADEAITRIKEIFAEWGYTKSPK
ncbi:MAG: ABC transporter substrate-binding protein [Xenococcaceae cyanobacterium MO_234.B1]|nr:ABC transporter substrate-binding protein [Xenococcaceae cyanobacterium MO_234.B1]